LTTPTVFLPEHKKGVRLMFLAELDPWTAIRGSEGEPETVSVLRPGSKVLVLETFEVKVKEQKWVVPKVSKASKKGPQNILDFMCGEEVYARDQGRLLSLREPIRYVFGRVRVLEPAAHTPDLGLRDPCGFLIECGDRKYEVASAPDYTGGYLETPGVVGTVFLQSVCETMTWSLAAEPDPSHADHDDSRRHEKVLAELDALRKKFAGNRNRDRKSLEPTSSKAKGSASSSGASSGAKNFRRREWRRQQKAAASK
jgi:hypothetical protein